MEIEEKELRAMNLHDTLEVNTHTYALRVIGGWVYVIQNKKFGEPVGEQWNMSSVFVPEK